MFFFLSTLPKTNIAPKKLGLPQKRNSSSNRPCFRWQFAVSCREGGGVPLLILHPIAMIQGGVQLLSSPSRRAVASVRLLLHVVRVPVSVAVLRCLTLSEAKSPVNGNSAKVATSTHEILHGNCVYFVFSETNLYWFPPCEYYRKVSGTDIFDLQKVRYALQEM